MKLQKPLLQEKELKSLLVIVLGLITFYFITREPLFIYTALAIGVLSLLIPHVGYAIVWFWFKLAYLLGWINSRIILSIIYFIFLTPMAWLYRLSKKDGLQLKAPEKSNFKERNHIFTDKDLEKTW